MLSSAPCTIHIGGTSAARRRFVLMWARSSLPSSSRRRPDRSKACTKSQYSGNGEDTLNVPGRIRRKYSVTNLSSSVGTSGGLGLNDLQSGSKPQCCAITSLALACGQRNAECKAKAPPAPSPLKAIRPRSADTRPHFAKTAELRVEYVQSQKSLISSRISATLASGKRR